MDKEQFFISLLESKKIGDDGAVFGDFIYSSDMFCEGVHFRREWLSLYQIARKSMLVNISDAVAMNAKVEAGLLSLQLPRAFSKDELIELRDGFEDCAREFGFEIIGGDTIGGRELNISITLISKSQNPLTRYGLSGGELLAYTGELGSVLEDLERLFKSQSIDKDSKFIEPTLRGDFIAKARDYLVAGMDISDGLFCDTNKLLDANQIGLEILKDIPQNVGESGEEYEMLIAFREENLEKILETSSATSTPITIFAKASKDNDFRFSGCRSYHF